MIRGYKGLTGGAFEEGGEDTNPMDGVGNLADVMLVFACGLMLALIAHWNVDLQILDVAQMQEVTEEIEIIDDPSSSSSAGSAFNELGVLYEDPESGLFYVITGAD